MGFVVEYRIWPQLGEKVGERDWGRTQKSDIFFCGLGGSLLFLLYRSFSFLMLGDMFIAWSWSIHHS